MSDIKPPLFIIDGLDVGIYSSVSDVQLDLEVIDVSNGVYTGYDSEGKLLSLTTGDGSIILNLAEDIPKHKDELIDRLSSFLNIVGELEGNEDKLDLSFLVNISKKYINTF